MQINPNALLQVNADLAKLSPEPNSESTELKELFDRALAAKTEESKDVEVTEEFLQPELPNEIAPPVLAPKIAVDTSTKLGTKEDATLVSNQVPHGKVVSPQNREVLSKNSPATELPALGQRVREEESSGVVASLPLEKMSRFPQIQHPVQALKNRSDSVEQKTESRVVVTPEKIPAHAQILDGRAALADGQPSRALKSNIREDQRLADLKIGETEAASGERFTNGANSNTQSRIPMGATLATNDFLDLRGGLKSGKSLKEEASLDQVLREKSTPIESFLGATVATPPANFASLGSNSLGTVDLPVNAGPNFDLRFDHQAVRQLSQQLRGIQVRGDNGELKLRLRPDHLGEIQMKVKTEGNRVSVEIIANDPKAKAILEQNMDQLKDSFELNQIKLSSFQVSSGFLSSGLENQVTQQAQSPLHQPMGSSNQDFSLDQQSRGQNQSRDQRNESRFQERSENQSPTNPNVPGRSRMTSPGSRLDLMA